MALPPSITLVNPLPDATTSGEAPITRSKSAARGAARSAMSAATATPSRIDCAAARDAPSGSFWPIRRDTSAIAPIDSPIATV